MRVRASEQRCVQDHARPLNLRHAERTVKRSPESVGYSRECGLLGSTCQPRGVFPACESVPNVSSAGYRRCHGLSSPCFWVVRRSAADSGRGGPNALVFVAWAFQPICLASWHGLSSPCALLRGMGVPPICPTIVSAWARIQAQSPKASTPVAFLSVVDTKPLGRVLHPSAEIVRIPLTLPCDRGASTQTGGGWHESRMPNVYRTGLSVNLRYT